MRTRLSLVLALVLAVSSLAAAALTASAPASAAIGPQVTNACLASVPEPNSEEPVQICYTLFRPEGASRSDRVPMIMHSHGWGGSRTTDPAAFERYLEHGYGVLSFDQRGFGESGGQAHVENPSFEGHDVRRLIALIASKSWVRKDAPGDPRMGAIGGSYGGGYQFLAAFESLRLRGTPVLDALAPEITWFDLKQSLAPEEVVRTEWAVALSAAAVPTNALPTPIYEALVEGAATGMWPDGSGPSGVDLDAFFRRNGPKWHVDHGRRLDIPALLGQGTTDTLFPLEQGITNFRRAITRDARAESIFVGYNGGHTLPSVLPPGFATAGDPCSIALGSSSFSGLALRFMSTKLLGKG
ncbi:MAG: alpha/beta hydrolase, partial [Nocardioides sp.]